MLRSTTSSTRTPAVVTRFARLLAVSVCVLTAAGLLTVGQSFTPGAGSASAANCFGATYNRYPGSTPSRLRFGQVTMTFSGCGATPSSWNLQASSHNNGTGSRLGYSINYARVDNSTIGGYYRFWNVVIGLKDCILKICSQAAEWRIKFYAYYDAGNLHLTQFDAVYTRGRPSEYALFTTP